MKFTSEDLLNAMGLKVGDKIILGESRFEILSRNNNIICAKCDEEPFMYAISLVELVDRDYTIIQPKPTLTEVENVILRNVEEPFKFITRSKNGAINVHISRVCRDVDWWENGVDMPFDHLFQFIKWEDEPYEIKDLLND